MVINEKVAEDIDELAKWLHGMNVQDTMYASTYANLCLAVPAFKAFILAFIWPGQQPATQSMPPQQPGWQNQQQNFRGQSPYRPMPPRWNVHPPNQFSSYWSTQPWSRTFDCHFCWGPNHGIKDCVIVEEYLAAGCVMKDQNGCLVFLNNEHIGTHWGGIKGAVDKHFQGSLQQQQPPPTANTSTAAATTGSSNFFQCSSTNASLFATITAVGTKESEGEMERQWEEEVKAFHEQ